MVPRMTCNLAVCWRAAGTDAEALATIIRETRQRQAGASGRGNATGAGCFYSPVVQDIAQTGRSMSASSLEVHRVFINIEGKSHKYGGRTRMKVRQYMRDHKTLHKCDKPRIDKDARYVRSKYGSIHSLSLESCVTM